MSHRLLVDPQVVAMFAGYRALVVYATGLDNRVGADEAHALLRAASEHVRSAFPYDIPSSHPHLQAWRQVFAAFGSKPSKHLCSAEALLKRVLKGGEIPSINPIVDTYNAVSLSCVIPVGGEDWDMLESDLCLKFARGNEPFEFRSEGVLAVEYPDVQEVIWADSRGVTCRRWNWRQCERTAVTSDTRSAYFVFDAIEPFGWAELEEAAEILMDHLSTTQRKISWQVERLT